jgi:hypothetical protein
MEGIQELAIVVTALLAIALGSIWYSPLVFGKYWQKAAGLSDADTMQDPRSLLTALVSAFIANTIVLTLLAYGIQAARELGVTGFYFGIGLTTFVGASLLSMVVWEKRSWVYFAIHAGYAALVIFFGISILTYWPW